MFKFLQRPIVLDCFTTSEIVAKVAPILPATRYFPEWWKALPGNFQSQESFFPEATMKKCSGFIDYYRKSIVLPLWSDLAVEVNNNRQYRWQFADLTTEIEVHPVGQRGSFLPHDSYGHLKLLSPWAFSTKQSVFWTMTQAFYSFKNPDMLLVMPGALDFSDVSATNVNTAINLTRPHKFILNVGQPLCFLTPMTDKPIKVVRHVVTEQEYKKITSDGRRISFTNSLKKRMNRAKQFSDCPFK